jgi:signal transduction histidine kinase
MSTADSLLEFVSSRHDPLRVWLGPVASESAEQLLQEQLGPAAEIRIVPDTSRPLLGPAILVLSAADLEGPLRHALLELARQARPGRPIVLGGSASRETLMDAINIWRAFRLVPEQTPQGAIVEAVRGAHEAYALELSVQRCARLLHQNCRQLSGALEELRATQERLLHAERLATVGRVVGTLMLHARDQLARMELFKAAQSHLKAKGALGERLDCALEGTRSFTTLLNDMLALSENRSMQTELHNELLDAVVESSTRLFRHDPLGRSRSIETACRSSATVGIDRYRISHVLLNLLRNAAQATQEGDRIEVRTSREPHAALIEVEDAGVGMNEEILAQIFTPFFTTKGKSGMGLGLRLAKATVERQGGTLDCTSTPGKGTCFRIRFPIAG